jgi:RimJ/RimL family protein N-acetyltransferase
MVYIGRVDLFNGEEVEDVLSIEAIQSLRRNMWECFHRPLDEIGHLSPSQLYVIALDLDYTEIIASATISSNLIALPLQYQQKPAYYLFNVCTYPPYQGQGYMKQLLTTVLANHTDPIYLTVESTNQSAKALYTRLGFAHIDTMEDRGKWYDVMVYLSL